MKQIIVPKDARAVHDLNYDVASEDQLLIWNLTDEQYRELDGLHIFDNINLECEAMIDEYEDDAIIFEKLSGIANILARNRNPMVQKLSALMLEALQRQTSIHFYF